MFCRRSPHRVACLGLLFLALSIPVMADVSSRDDVRGFMQHMHETHGFGMQELRELFAGARIRDDILKAISRPAEKKAWHQYRPLFLQPTRIKQGVVFWRKHQGTLSRAQRRYGVPPEIIVAIIGVETNYGKNTGGYRVIDALSTLAFAYPRRSAFFRSELEHYLLLCQEQGMNPATLKGSYAGAMGLPQFISSSYRNYAVDFDGDDKNDIWNNPTDAIGSVANYFHRHGWQEGGEVSFPVSAQGADYQNLVSQDLDFWVPFPELARHGIHSPHSLPADTPVKLLELHLEEGIELWLALHNFRVITSYNRSTLYAMAVHQLSQAIRGAYPGHTD